MYSRIAFWICASAMLFAAIFYYPKWEQTKTEATLSWDVSGYYLYLPAIFIYDDIRQLSFMPEKVLVDYQPTPDFQQAYLHESGNYVLKYPIGLAVLYSPFFAIAHTWASYHSEYAADGFSYPYQIMISLGSLLVALLGLWCLRIVLLHYFEDKMVAATLLVLVLASNYLEYGSITATMTHSWLFSLYALLLLLTIKFYRHPKNSLAIGIGLCVGIIALTRPTEIIACLIPICWHVNNKKEISARFAFLQQHKTKIVLALLFSLLVASFQFIYWKYATGEWIVYSYQEQGFSWLRPHLKEGFFSYKSGWLVYSPAMGFALIGFWYLFKNYRTLFFALFIYALIHIYITFAWDIWWYGGSLGQRSMVQAYPALAFPLAAFFTAIKPQKWISILVAALSVLFMVYNFWLIHHAHKGGLLKPGLMTEAYFWAIVGRDAVPYETNKLLDTDDLFRGERQHVQLIFQDDFESQAVDSFYIDYYGTIAQRINEMYQFTSETVLPASIVPEEAEWLRIKAQYYIFVKETDLWKMAQLCVQFSKGEERVKKRVIRLHRFLVEHQWTTVYMDIRIPKKDFDTIAIWHWNGNGIRTVIIDDLSVESFEEE